MAALFSTVQSAPAGAAVPGAFTRAGSMSTARYDHAAVRSERRPGPRDRRLGQQVGGALHSVDEALVARRDMKDIRADFTLTLLKDGRVLAVGGDNSGAQATAELYNPATNTWTRTGSMTYAREEHTATLLADGKVLIAGGDGYYAAPDTSELLTPAPGRSVPSAT